MSKEIYQNDFSNDIHKDSSRNYNIEQVKRSRVLFNHQTNTLSYDWAELAGIGAPTYQKLQDLKYLVPGQSRFLGIDRSDTVFNSLVQQFDRESSIHCFFQESLEDWIWGDHATNIGVLNYDTFHLSGGEHLAENLIPIIAFARSQQKKFGNFALIVNFGTDRGKGVEDLKEILDKFNIRLDDRLLQLPGSFYHGSRNANRKSHRINYCIHFGPVTPLKENHL